MHSIKFYFVAVHVRILLAKVEVHHARFGPADIAADISDCLRR